MITRLLRAVAAALPGGSAPKALPAGDSHDVGAGARTTRRRRRGRSEAERRFDDAHERLKAAIPPPDEHG